MSAYFSLTSHAPGAAELVLVDGPPYSPWVLVGKDLGNPTWKHSVSGARGTQGRRPASGVPDDRRTAFTLLSDDQADKDELATTLAALAATIDEMRRFGGLVTFREHAQTYKQTLEALIGEISIAEWGSREFDLRDAVRPALTFTCAPYIAGEPMDIDEPFDDAGRLDDFAAEAGVVTDLAVSGGDLTATASLTSTFRLIHAARGYVMGDQRVTLHGTVGSTLSGFKAGVVLKATDSTNRLECHVSDDGTTSWVTASSVVAGFATSGANSLAARLVAGQEFWLRGTFANGRLLASFYGEDPDGLDPDDPGDWAETTSLTYGVRGRAGLLWTPQHAAARIHRMEAGPFYSAPSIVVPRKVMVHRHDGAIPGDAPALCDVDIRFPAGGPAESQFGLFAWWRRPEPHNLIRGGGFEEPAWMTPLWSAAAVTGFMGAATSVTQTASADAKYGGYVGVVVTPATANTGAHVRISGQFMRGETYTARVWVRAPSSTTPVRLRLGNPTVGFIQSTTAVALSSTWTLHEITWQPFIDTDHAYLGVEVTAATATTFHIDGACLFLGTTEPPAEHLAGEGGVPPFGVIEAENAFISGSGGNTAVIATDANASGGRVVEVASVLASGGGVSLHWPIDPSLVYPDDYSGQSVSVVAYMRAYLHSVFTTGKTYISAYGEFDAASAIVTSAEFGGAQQEFAVSETGWRLVRLGTLTIPISRRRPVWHLSASLSVPAGTNLQRIAVDYLALVPARGHVSSPTAKPTTGYPTFLPSEPGARRRVLHADGSSDLGVGTRPLMRASGMNGVIEVPPGDIESLALTSQEIPNDPAGAARATADEDLPHVHLAITPRWSYLREAP